MTVIAIDGPSGAGKSTVARAVAQALGFSYLDTGALYRAVALGALEAGIAPADRAAVERVSASLDLAWEDGRMLLDGRDVTERIRAPDVTRAASVVSAYPRVRAALLAKQREIAGSNDVVVEGRDIGTVVFPDAPLKLFLTASPRERALRRVRQLGLPEDESRVDEVEGSMRARDEADAGRPSSPFTKAADAVTVDSSQRDFDSVVAEIVALAEDATRAR